VDVWNVGAFERGEAELHRRAAHHFAPIRRGIDVAMAAGLVAEFSDIDLEVLDAARAKRPEAERSERFIEVARERKRFQNGALVRALREREPARVETLLRGFHIEIVSARLRI